MGKKKSSAVKARALGEFQGMVHEKEKTCASTNLKRLWCFLRLLILSLFRMPGMSEGTILGKTYDQFMKEFPGTDNSSGRQYALVKLVLGSKYNQQHLKLVLKGRAKAEELFARIFNWVVRAHQTQEMLPETIVNFDNPQCGVISKPGAQWQADQSVIDAKFSADRVQEIFAVQNGIDLNSMPVGAAVAEKKGDQEEMEKMQMEMQMQMQMQMEMMEENQKITAMMAKQDELAQRELGKQRVDQQELVSLRKENDALKMMVWELEKQLKGVKDKLQRAGPTQMRMDSPSYSEEVFLTRPMADRTNPATLLPPLTRQSSGLSSNSSEGCSADTGFTDGGFASCAAAVHHLAVEPAPPPMAETAMMDDTYFQNY